MVKRFIYGELEELIRQFPVVGIIGPRQVGKTTLARSLAAASGKTAIYLDLENPRDVQALEDPVLFFEANIDKLIILDEVQRLPALYPILRSVVDMNRRPGRFIVLGSATPDLIRDSSESLAGRIAYRELFPLNIPELQTMDEFKLFHHWFRGGYPDAYLVATDKQARRWTMNFVRTYMERDLPILGLSIDINTIRTLWTMLAHLNGDVLNYQLIAKSLGLSSVTVKRYVSFMEHAFLIRLLQPYASNTKKRLIKSPKVVMRDTGVLHYLMGIDSLERLLTHPQRGNSWEAYCIEQVASVLDPSYELCFYRTQHGAECDLVILKGGQPFIAAEIKLTSAPTRSKGMLQAFEDLGTLKRYVIIPSGLRVPWPDNITVMDLKSFINEVIYPLSEINYPSNIKV